MDNVKKNAWVIFTVIKYGAFFCIPFGFGLICVGTDFYLYWNFRVRFEPKLYFYSNKSVLTFSTNQTGKMYRILWYAPPFWMSDSRKETKQTKFCEYKNCEISFNKSEVGTSDLVLFHHQDMNIKPPPKSADQKWVFVSVEAPPTTSNYYNRKQWKNKFDWTMTYRTDSEGYASYGTITRNKNIDKRNYTLIYGRKIKNVAWLVSHCKTISKRENFVQELSKHIDVDIFGKCGKACPVGGMDCLKHLSEQYKFFLSFENSLCHDYITEKLYRVFNEDIDMIPIVRGAPNVKQLLTNQTFISTSDFSSPTKLAQYLKYIGSDETKYSEILKLKHLYMNSADLYENGLCSLCHKLNRKFKRKENLDLSKMMSRSQCVLPTDI